MPFVQAILGCTDLEQFFAFASVYPAGIFVDLLLLYFVLRPSQKENANFCEYWHGNNNAFKPTHKTSGSEAKAKLNALFGNSDDNAPGDSEHGADAEETTQQVNAESPLSAEEKAKAELQALFGAPSKKP